MELSPGPAAAVAAAATAPGHMRSASGASAGSSVGGPPGGAASRSLSMNSVSSEGSNESHLVEQEDIVALTHDVRGFKEALSRLRRIFHPDREKQEVLRVAAHERMGDVLRILRAIIERYPPLQSTELLMAAGHLIQQVKSFNYEDEKCNPTDFFETIDQLALAFSSRVSEYLMGDIDTSSALHPATRTRSCENLLPGDAEHEEPNFKDSGRESETLTAEEIDEILMKLENGVNVAFYRAKVWSKYAKDIMTYIEKRTTLEAEYSRNLAKLAHNIRTNVKEESYLPFQSIYCTALDQDIENSNVCQMTCSALQEHKFVEPLLSRKGEHERQRKQIKDNWQRELKKTQEAVSNLRKARSQYIQRNHDYEKAKNSVEKAKAENSEGSEGSKVDRKRRVEDDALQKVSDAEIFYKSCVEIANDRHLVLENTKAVVFKQVRELMIQCDQTMKAVTVGYFQMQHTISAPAPVQFQTLCESSRLYEPGSQYMQFVKRLSVHNALHSIAQNTTGTPSFRFEPYLADSRFSDKERRSVDSFDATEDSPDKLRGPHPVKPWGPAVTAVLGSDSDSVGSSQSNKSRDTSPSASPQVPLRRLASHTSSGDELDIDGETIDHGFGAPSGKSDISKAAATHTIRKLKTLAKCRECDTYVYFQGVECSKCGLASHKKCLETLAIQCGHKRLPRRMTTFGVDLCSHLSETKVCVPPLVTKCVREIDQRGIRVKGIYRTSGVKSRVEKLCQSFENGASLVDLSDVHPNVIANVLKLYLRQLPEPLLTFRYYPEFIRIAKDYQLKTTDEENDNKTRKELKDVICKLTPGHQATLTTLIHHLKRVSDHSEENNMPPSNIGIVFGPTLLRTSESGASLTSLVDTVHQAKVVELLINFATELFGEDLNHRRRDEVGTQSKFHAVVEQKVEDENEIPGYSSSTNCEKVDQINTAKREHVRTLHNESTTKSIVDTGTRSCSTPSEWAGKPGRLEEHFFPAEQPQNPSKHHTASPVTCKEPVTDTKLVLEESGDHHGGISCLVNTSRTATSGVTLQTSEDSVESVNSPLHRCLSMSRKTVAQLKSATEAVTPAAVGACRRTEKTTTGVATQTDASFLRNLWTSPAPPPRKHGAISTMVTGGASECASSIAGHSDATGSTSAKRSSSSGDVLDRIVIHVAGPGIVEDQPVGERLSHASLERGSSYAGAPVDRNSRVQMVRSDPPSSSKRAAASMVKSRSEESSSQSARGLVSGNADGGHPVKTPAAKLERSKRIDSTTDRHDSSSKSNFDDDDKKVVHLSVPQNQADQDSGFEDARPSPDCSPSRYISPYLSDDPYKKYRLGTGSPLPISKTSTFANYDLPGPRSSVPALQQKPLPAEGNEPFGRSSAAGQYASNSSLGSSSLRGSSQDSLNEHYHVSATEPHIISSSAVPPARTVGRETSTPLAASTTNCTATPPQSLSHDDDESIAGSSTGGATGQSSSKLTESTLSQIDREPHYV